MIKTDKQLPDKLSDLIELAVNDMKALARTRKYEFDLGCWHIPATLEDNDKCAVCFAGAVMANTLEVKIDEWAEAHDFEQEISRKLLALDYVRDGGLGLALGCMHAPDQSQQLFLKDADWIELEFESYYGKSLQDKRIRAKFYAEMASLVTILRKYEL